MKTILAAAMRRETVQTIGLTVRKSGDVWSAGAGYLIVPGHLSAVAVCDVQSVDSLMVRICFQTASETR